MEMEDMIKEMKRRFKPYAEKFPSFKSLPEKGLDREKILELVRSMVSAEDKRWRDGYVSGAVYNGERDHVDFTNLAYSIASQVNPLHPDVWPSSLKFENEIVSMVGSMLHGDDRIRGTVTSGGTESILLAMKTYRDYAMAERGITAPEIVLPVSAHAAFDKACHYFGIKPVWTELRDDYSADPERIKEKINENTIAIVGSAPGFPYGVIDPLKRLSDVAVEKGVPLHVDACLGGFLLPWAKKLGYDIPEFDFNLEGVTSISVDTHKYGYAPKGTSVILYRNSELFQHQLYVKGDWPGGIYFSPALAGSRSGGVIASAWAALLEMGKSGYLEYARRILETASEIRRGVKEIAGLKLMGESPFVIAFTSDEVNIYRVMDLMARRSWNLNGLHRPPGVHLAVTIRHTMRGVAERFLADLSQSVVEARKNTEEDSGMAPIYGMAATFPSDAVREIMKTLVEWMYS